MSGLQALVLQTLSELGSLGRERIVGASDAGSAGRGMSSAPIRQFLNLAKTIGSLGRASPASSAWSR
ncbi:hypothetical protein GCM10023334_067700 [Nonomuraea thailandensis]